MAGNAEFGVIFLTACVWETLPGQRCGAAAAAVDLLLPGSLCAEHATARIEERWEAERRVLRERTTFTPEAAIEEASRIAREHRDEQR